MRRHIRIWMRDAYGFRLGKIFDGEKDKEKAKENYDAKKVKVVGGEYKTRLGKSLACIFGSTSECPDKTPPDSNNTRGPSSDGQAAADATQQSITDNIGKTTGKNFAKDIAKDLLKILTKKLFPVIGWFDMAAHMDDFLWNNRADAVIKYVRSAALADYYGAMQVANDQATTGENTSGAEVNAAITGLRDMEKSCEYQRINQGGPKQGCEKVGLEKRVSTGAYGQAFTWMYQHNPQLGGLHPAYAAYLKTPISDILGWVGGVGDWIIKHIPILGPFYENVTDWIATKFIDLLSFILNPGCTGHESGAESYNCASGGADVTYNDAADNVLGAPKVSDHKAYQIDTQIAIDNDKYEASKGLWHRIASLDYQHSLVNLLIARIPSDPLGSTLDRANTMMASTNWFNFSSLFLSPFQGKLAYADTADDAFGVEQHRYSDAELSGDIDDAALTKAWDNAKADGRTRIMDIKPEDCPDPEKRPNLCMLDLATLQSMYAAFTTDDDGGLPAEAGAGGTDTPGAQLPANCAAAPGAIPNAPIPPDDYTHVSTHGVTLNKRTLAMLTVAEGYYGGTIPLSQGSYNAGGVAASAGTHDGGGALDVSVRNMSQAQILKAVLALRQAGFAAWERVPAEGFVHHIHAIAIGDKEAAPLAKDQVQDYFDGKSGLASHKADRNASLGRPYPDWARGYCK